MPTRLYTYGINNCVYINAANFLCCVCPLTSLEYQRAAAAARWKQDEQRRASDSELHRFTLRQREQRERGLMTSEECIVRAWIREERRVL